MRHLLFSAIFLLCLLVCFGPLAWAAGQPPPVNMVLSNGTRISISNLAEAHRFPFEGN